MAWVSAKELDWDALYADQLPRIYNYFRFRVGNDADAEDLAARTFESAWRARERWSGACALSPHIGPGQESESLTSRLDGGAPSTQDLVSGACPGVRTPPQNFQATLRAAQGF
jgi:hypothetical protein